MRKAVISLGGSILFNEKGLDSEFIAKLAQMLLKLNSTVRLAVVVGGGRYARDYAGAVTLAKGSQFLADRAAIYVTKANATLLQAALGETAFPRLIQSLDDAAMAMNEGKIAVGCGILEGVSTDFDSMLVAERVGADLVVNASNLDGIFTADPKKDPSAKKFKTMTHAQLVEMAGASDLRKAGTNFVFDSVASKLSARAGIELQFVNGKDLKQLEAAILGKPHAGTIVRD